MPKLTNLQSRYIAGRGYVFESSPFRVQQHDAHPRRHPHKLDRLDDQLVVALDVAGPLTTSAEPMFVGVNVFTFRRHRQADGRFGPPFQVRLSPYWAVEANPRTINSVLTDLSNIPGTVFVGHNIFGYDYPKLANWGVDVSHLIPKSVDLLLFADCVLARRTGRRSPDVVLSRKNTRLVDLMKQNGGKKLVPRDALSEYTGGSQTIRLIGDREAWDRRFHKEFTRCSELGTPDVLANEALHKVRWPTLATAVMDNEIDCTGPAYVYRHWLVNQRLWAPGTEQQIELTKNPDYTEQRPLTKRDMAILLNQEPLMTLEEWSAADFYYEDSVLKTTATSAVVKRLMGTPEIDASQTMSPI